MAAVEESDTLEGRRLLAAICVAGPALVCLIPMAAAPAIPAMATRFGGKLFAQMVMTAPAIMLILSAPIAGALAARYGRRIVLLFSLLLYVVGGAGVLLIDSATPLIALRLLLGIAGGAMLTSSLALIGDFFEGKAREALLGYATSISSAVAALALTFGGGLVDHWGWRAPFSLYLFGLPILAIATRVIPAHRGTMREDLAHEGEYLFPLLRVLPAYILLMLLTIGMFIPAIQVAFVLQARGIESAAIQGTIISSCSVVAMFSAGFYGVVRRWLSAHALLAIDAASMGVGVIIIALSTSSLGMVFGCAIVGIGAGMSEPATASIIFDKTPAGVHALAMGLIVSALNLGIFINPLAMAPLRDTFGIVTAFEMFGALMLCVALLVVVAGRGRRRNPADRLSTLSH